MPRNIEKDAMEEKRRRQQLLDAGLKLFAQRGIENVKLQEIADEAGVGIATLYNYYQNKFNLVNAISANMWKTVWDENIRSNGAANIESFNAYQRIEGYFDLIIMLYKEHPEILRFSSYYKTYINMENSVKTEDNEHLTVLAPISGIFHDFYEKARIDKSIRTDVDEKQLFTCLALTMLGMAERYAQGLVWAGNAENDYTNELLLLKDMMLKWLKSED